MAGAESEHVASMTHKTSGLCGTRDIFVSKDLVDVIIF